MRRKMGETHVQTRGVARAHLALKDDLAVAQSDGARQKQVSTVSMPSII